MTAKQKKLLYYKTQIGDVRDSLYRIVKKNCLVETVHILFNGGYAAGYLVNVDKKQFTWIPLNNKEMVPFEFEGGLDGVAFLQTLNNLDIIKETPHWWVCTIGNSGRKGTEKVTYTQKIPDILEFDLGGLK